MAEQTNAIELRPWPISLYTNSDGLQIPQQMLQEAENALYNGTRDQPGGCTQRPGIARQVNSSTVQIDSANTPDVLFLIDYWANVNNVKQDRFVAVTANNKVYSDTFAGQWSTQISDTSNVTINNLELGGITAEVMNEDLILGLKNSTDSIVVWEAQDTATLLVKLSSTTGFSASPASGSFFQGVNRCWITRQHQNRMFYAGDPQNPDRLYFSKAGVYNQFLTTGTNPAGNIDIFPGDGDPEGITSIFPSINSQELYVAKRSNLYKIITSDTNPNNWPVIKVSDEIGCVNHNTAKSIDQRDIYFESNLGIHSLFQVISGTQIIDGALVSFPITKDFRTVIDQSVKSTHSAIYDPQQNIYLLSVQTVDNTAPDAIYCYDLETGGWSRWSTSADVEFNFLTKRFNETTGATEIYFADKEGWVNRFNPDELSDINNNAIALTLKTATILPQGTFLRESNFTDIYLLVRATGSTSVDVSYRVDDQELVSLSETITAEGGNILDTTLLGDNTFILGIARGVRPLPYKIAGVGYSIEITVEHSQLETNIQIYGLIIKFNNSEETRVQAGY